MNLKYDVKISKTHQVHEVLVRLKERGFSRPENCPFPEQLVSDRAGYI